MAGQNTTAKTTAAKAAEPEVSAVEEFTAVANEKAAENNGLLELTPDDLPAGVGVEFYVGIPGSGVTLFLRADGGVSWLSSRGQTGDLVPSAEAVEVNSK